MIKSVHYIIFFCMFICLHGQQEKVQEISYRSFFPLKESAVLAKSFPQKEERTEQRTFMQKIGFQKKKLEYTLAWKY